MSVCQHVLGECLNQAVGQLLIDTVTPLALEVKLTVQQETQADDHFGQTGAHPSSDGR